jgi:hypothetical protein
VRAKRAPDSCFCARSAPPRGRPMAAKASKRQGIKQNGTQIPKKFPEGALRARRFAPASAGGSVADSPHIFCRLGGTTHPRPRASKAVLAQSEQGGAGCRGWGVVPVLYVHMCWGGGRARGRWAGASDYRL